MQQEGEAGEKKKREHFANFMLDGVNIKLPFMASVLGQQPHLADEPNNS